MVGLLVTLNGRAPIAAAHAEDGVLSVCVHVLRAERTGGLVAEACVEVGALLCSKSGDRHVKWLREALRPGDDIEIVVAEIGHPDPGSEDLEYPEPLSECPSGIEIMLNGTTVASRTAAGEPKGVALAMVTWSRGAATNPSPGEHVHLDVGLDYSKLLSVGDTVRIRMLGA